MRYCTFCGTALEDGDVYCSKCGRKTTAQTWQIPHCSLPKSAPAEPKNKLCCELAYTGTLFWLPLIVCPGEKDARYHANQGLWLLILSVAACTGIRLLSAVNEFLAGRLLGAVFGGVYSLLFILFLFGMLFLLWSAVTRAMDIHRDEAARPILFFEKIPIIRVKKEGE
ncbi:hypothetical protein B5F07_15735 [Lachnoclostridium sp. An169]|uniref:zinc-ribbon domain-containing protein n=1 Tax=Lachnoclostridium sp. An169 TaxID=1965569 RepID=UPI000B393556|nr:zinc ribbon domain-containing protein [Lachnoclostridium sp. An169]OUP81866.1 hypothetical protein B5F07_15735 [Lachnoclostridium sp. An169]HJA67915.1 zinc ribbon domain-containing protein [Candidatus Mediterraneibacter cottocaccae]